MTLKDEENRKITDKKLNEEKLKHYFLGELSKAENDSFEEEIASDAQLTEAAQIVESELIDDYLRGNLSASDRESFEAVYLNGAARREKLQISESLWRAASEQKSSEIIAAESSPSFWQTWKMWRVAFAGAAALLLIGAFVFSWLNSGDQAEIARQQNTNQPLQSPQFTTPKIENQNTLPIENTNSVNQKVNDSNAPQNKLIAPTPAPKTTPTPPPVIKPPAQALASFTLSPGTLRDEGEQFIKITPTAQKINLRLNLPKDAAKYQIYSAVIKTADGETVFTWSNLKSLNLTLPAEKIENRTYMIFLEGQNATNAFESVAEYTFRARR